MAGINLLALDVEGQCVERDPEGKSSRQSGGKIREHIPHPRAPHPGFCCYLPLDLLDAGQDKNSASSHHDWGAPAEPCKLRA